MRARSVLAFGMAFALPAVVLAQASRAAKPGAPKAAASRLVVMPATTSCDKGSDCVFFAESNGKFDLKLVDAARCPRRNRALRRYTSRNWWFPHRTC
jgi:hypothetical protein